MRKILALTLFLLVISAIFAVPASAGVTWCVVDPNVKLPDGGIVHIRVSVPKDHQGEDFTLNLAAPAGSRLVGNAGTIHVVLTEGNDNQIVATLQPGFEVRLAAHHQGLQPTGVVELGPDGGTVTWNW
jgi:hypothetical protein